MDRNYLLKAGLMIFLLFIFLSTATGRANASRNEGWRTKIRQSTWSDFSRGELEGARITRSGEVQLFVGSYWGNEFVAKSRYTSDARLDRDQKRLSMRFNAEENKRPVRIRIYLYQRGKVKNWRVRLEGDDGSENHLPSGKLAWEGAESLVALEESGWVIVPIEPGRLKSGEIYHLVLEPAGTPNANDYVFPSATEPLNERWVGGSTGNEERAVLFSSDGGKSWAQLKDREPVYIMDFSDGTHWGNPYYSYTSKSISGEDFHGEKFSPQASLSAGGVEFYVERTSAKPSDSLYVTVEKEGEVLVSSVENKDPVGTDYGWVRFEFPSSLSLSEVENYRIYLSSLGSGGDGYYYVDYLNAPDGEPYSSLGYGGKSSFYIDSEDSGSTWSPGESEDLAFRFITSYRARGTYTSQVFDVGTEVDWKKVSWNARSPGGTNLNLWTRSSEDGDSWSDWEKCANGGEPISPDGRYFQYRAVLETNDSSLTPVLREVTIKYEDSLPPEVEDLEPFSGQILADRRPTISARIEDDLSGVDPGSVEMWIENAEVDSTYELVTGEVWYQASKPFDRDNVKVRLEASDRAGNPTSRKWSFQVKPSAVSFGLSENSAKSMDGVSYNSNPGELNLEPTRKGVVADNFPSPGDGSRTPRDIALAENRLWIIDSADDKLYQTTFGGEKVFEVPTFGSSPVGVAYDGNYLWYADSDPARVYELDPRVLKKDGAMSKAIVDSWETPVEEPAGLSYGAGHLWVSSDVDGRETIYKLTPGGRVVENLPAPGSSPRGIAHGSSLWYSDGAEDRIYRLGEDGKILGSFSSPESSPRGIACRGGSLWHADSSPDEVYRIHPFEYSAEGSYTSRPFDAGGRAKWALVSWDADLPDGTSLSVEARVSKTGREWTTWHRCTDRKPFPGPAGRYIQYRVNLYSSVASRTPVLRELEFVAIDNVPPRLSEPSPSDDGFVSSRRPRISIGAWDELSGIDNSTAIIRIDNRAAEHCEILDGRVWYSPPSSLEEGTHLARAEAKDLEGNSAEEIWTFEVDTEPPELVITHPADNSSTRDGKVEVRGSVDEPVQSVEVDGKKVSVENGRFVTEVNLDEGRNSIAVSAVDRAGNLTQDSVAVERKDSISFLFLLTLASGLAAGLLVGAFLSSRSRKDWKGYYSRASEFFHEKVLKDKDVE